MSLRKLRGPDIDTVYLAALPMITGSTLDLHVATLNFHARVCSTGVYFRLLEEVAPDAGMWDHWAMLPDREHDLYWQHGVAARLCYR